MIQKHARGCLIEISQKKVLYLSVKNSTPAPKPIHAMVEEMFKKIEIKERYNFPKDGDYKLDAACHALSNDLKNASKAKEKQDTAEVKQALDNL